MLKWLKAVLYETEFV